MSMVDKLVLTVLYDFKRVLHQSFPDQTPLTPHFVSSHCSGEKTYHGNVQNKFQIFCFEVPSKSLGFLMEI